MITAAELKTACNRLLKERYPAMDIYGTATAEKFEKPCFFTEILLYGLKYESRNWAKISAGYKITLMQQTPDEAEQLRAVEEIRKLFGLKLPVGTRKINITGFDYDYAGQYHDLLQITIVFDWYENLHEPETGDLMQNIEVNTAQKGD